MKTREVAGTVCASLAAIGLMAAVVLAPGCSKEPKKDAGGAAPTAITGKPTTEVASVNGDAITLQDVDRVLTVWKSGKVPSVDPNQPEGALQAKAVDELIGQKLLYAEAVKAGKAPADAEVQAALQQAKGQFPRASAFDSALAQQNLTEAALLQGFKVDTAIRNYIKSAVQDTINVTPDQAKAYYGSHGQDFQHPEQVHVRHIFVRVDASAAPAQVEAAHQKALAAYAELHKGEDFAEVAGEKSEDPSASKNGGDMGLVSKGQLPAPLDSLAFALPAGQLSQVVRSQFGFHIFKIVEKKPAGPFAFEDVQPRLTQMLISQRTNSKVESIVNDLKAKAKIKRKV